MGVDPSGYYEDGDDLGGTSDNPYLAYSDVRALLDCANDPATCDDDTGDTGNPGGSDDGSTPSSGGTPIDCGGCAGRLHGPTGFEVTLFGALGGFLLRRRRRFLPRLPL